jgi:hypothetical protein
MKFIVSRKPKEYLKQGLTGCGAYSVKGILSAYGKDDKRHPLQYSITAVLPIIATWRRWVRILRGYGLNAERRSVKGLSSECRLSTLKGLIQQDTPVMLSIGNGYRGCGVWSKWQWRVVNHWITLWGFDDEKNLFYIYDSAVPKRCYDANLPNGNVARSYNQVLRDIEGGYLTWWRRHIYIYIS